MSYSTLNKLSSKNVYCPPSNLHDPLTMCLVNTMDRKLQFGGEIGNRSGPQSEECQSYLSQRCAKQWDGFCEYVYTQYSTDKSFPNNKRTFNPLMSAWEREQGILSPQTVGDHLVHNTAREKFCTYTDCMIKEEPFSPFVANSAKIKKYHGKCIPRCTVDPATIDQDPVMNRALRNPVASAQTIMNICNTSRRENVDLSNTKIGALCQNYFAHESVNSQSS